MGVAQGDPHDFRSFVLCDPWTIPTADAPSADEAEMGKHKAVEEVFDSFAQRFIREQADRVVRDARLLSVETEDIAQDLRLHLWRRRGAYDQQRGAWSTFVRCLIQRKADSLLTMQRATRRARVKEAFSIDEVRETPTGVLTGVDRLERLDREQHHPRGGLPSFTDAEMRLDVDRAIQRLNPKDQELARRLMNDRVAEVSWDTGVPRATLYGRIGRLRRGFEAAGVSVDGPRRRFRSRSSR